LRDRGERGGERGKGGEGKEGKVKSGSRVGGEREKVPSLCKKKREDKEYFKYFKTYSSKKVI